MAYGTVKVDNITFDQGGVDQNVTVSGLYRAATSGVTVSGTISGAFIIGGTSVSGATVQGTTVTGTTVQGVSGTFTSLTGITTTGTTANFVSGVFTTQVSGLTVTGTQSSFTSGNFINLSGTTVQGGTSTFTSGVFASGTAALPSVSFVSDPNTGIYSPGADQVAISTNGTASLTVGSTGTVTVNRGVLQLGPVAGEGGQLDIRNPTDTGTVCIVDAVDATNARFFTANNNTDLQIGQLAGTGGNVRLFTGAAERARIDSSGRVLIGATVIEAFFDGVLNVAGRIHQKFSSGDAMYIWNTGTTGTRNLVNFGTGSTYGTVGTISTNGSTTSYNTTSDYRLKENIVPLTGAIDRLQEIPVYRFNFIADPDKTVDGFIAHEAQAVVPECVTGTKDEVDEDGNPVYQGIDQSKLVPLLTAALQEALAKIEDLEGRLTAAGL